MPLNCRRHEVYSLETMHIFAPAQWRFMAIGMCFRALLCLYLVCDLSEGVAKVQISQGTFKL